MSGEATGVVFGIFALAALGPFVIGAAAIAATAAGAARASRSIRESNQRRAAQQAAQQRYQQQSYSNAGSQSYSNTRQSYTAPAQTRIPQSNYTPQPSYTAPAQNSYAQQQERREQERREQQRRRDEQRRREEQIAVNNCSRELDSLYSEMRETARQERMANERYSEEMAARFDKIAQELNSIGTQNISTEQIDSRIAQSRQQMNAEYAKQREVFKAEIDKGNRAISQTIAKIDQSNAEKQQLVQWEQQTAAALQMQRAAAESALRDAEASVKLLTNMAESDGGIEFRRKAASIKAAYERARGMFDQNMYQSAFSNARTVIRETAMAVSENVQQRLETDMLEDQLRARLEGLHEELLQRRFIVFNNGAREDKRQEKGDLYRFSQGRYKETVEALEQQMEALDAKSGTLSEYELTKAIEEFDTQTQPDAKRMVDKSVNVMRGYYERLIALDVIADFMTEQNYTMQWAAPVGNDLSQKLVVNFRQNSTGNEISVTLDNDFDSGDLSKMAMEVLTFNGSGQPVSETEKQRLRTLLNKKLEQSGLRGSIACSGKVNQESDRKEYTSKEQVKQLQPRQLF